MIRIIELRKNGRVRFDVERRKSFLFFRWWEWVDSCPTEEMAYKRVRDMAGEDYKHIIHTF